MRNEAIDYLENLINYQFRDKTLLKRALIHTSYVNENRLLNDESNERLEFLGDSVLGLIISAILYNQDKILPEGDMTKLRSKLVNERALACISRKISLGEYLYLGNGEDVNGGRYRFSITSSALEALIGAVYLDAGFYAAYDMVEGIFKEIIHKALIKDDFFEDYKTVLQEYTQKVNLGNPVYSVVSETGPDHDKLYRVSVNLSETEMFGVGEGSSKKEAEKNAAKELLQKIQL